MPHEVSIVYSSYCAESLDEYEYFQNASLNYLNQGDGALRVLCKRSIMCYFASLKNNAVMMIIFLPDSSILIIVSSYYYLILNINK